MKPKLIYTPPTDKPTAAQFRRARAKAADHGLLPGRVLLLQGAVEVAAEEHFAAFLKGRGLVPVVEDCGSLPAAYREGLFAHRDGGFYHQRGTALRRVSQPAAVEVLVKLLTTRGGHSCGAQGLRAMFWRSR